MSLFSPLVFVVLSALCFFFSSSPFHTQSTAVLSALCFLFPLSLFFSPCCCCLLISLPALLSNLTAGSFLCWNRAHAGLLPGKVRCGMRVFGPPSSVFSSLLLPLLLPPLGSVQMAEAGRPDLGGVLAEQHLSPALERAYHSHDLVTLAALLPASASLLSQASHEGQTYSWCMQCGWQSASLLIRSPWHSILVDSSSISAMLSITNNNLQWEDMIAFYISFKGRKWHIHCHTYFRQQEM